LNIYFAKKNWLFKPIPFLGY